MDEFVSGDILKKSRKLLKTGEINIKIKLPSEPEYRIGDMFLYPFWRKQGYGGENHETGEDMTGEEYHLKYFPDSIASEYMMKSKKSKNFDVLFDIINSRKKYHILPPKNTLVMHLRVGDVIDDRGWNDKSVKDLLTYGSLYVKSLYSIYKILNCAIRNGIESVHIVYGFHKEGKFLKSKLYLACVYLYCKENGFDVKLITQSDADKALVYLTYSDLFAPSGGGFSYIISRLVKKNGKKVCRVR